MKSMIVIGDIHGCYKTMMKLIKKFPAEVSYCMAGDLMDRGPASRKVIQHCIDNNIPTVLGNHELMMGYMDPALRECWFQNGGIQTIQEYFTKPIYEQAMANLIGVQEYATDYKTLENHERWIQSLPFYLEFKDITRKDGRHLVVSHTTIAQYWEKRDLPQARFEGVWARKSIPKDIKTIFNIYGHTPVTKPLIREHFANIDTGCVYNGSFKKGTLTALQFPEMILYQEKCIDFDD
jgi:serine/threonine protein phosphatase 1